MKTIIYIRTSTEEQNPENQLKDCLSINTYGDYELIEDKQSAWKDNKERTGFERIKQLIKSNTIEHLIVWDFDRIYRNRLKFKEFLEYLKAFNVKLHSYRQTWFEDLYKIPNPWNDIVLDLMINIYGHIAEEESKKKSERVKIAVRRDEGITKSYKGNKWGRKALSKEIMDQIRKARQEGKSITQICKEVYYWDKNNHQKYVSRAVVHKIISQNSAIS